MAKRENYMPRTREYFERLGWIFEKTEHYNPYAGKTTDFCNFADAIAFSPLMKQTVAIQITGSGDWRKRERKILENGRALAWMMAGNEIWIVHYKKYMEQYRDARGAQRERKAFEMRINTVDMKDFGRVDAIEMTVVNRAEATAQQIELFNVVVDKFKEMQQCQASRA